MYPPINCISLKPWRLVTLRVGISCGNMSSLRSRQRCVSFIIRSWLMPSLLKLMVLWILNRSAISASSASLDWCVSRFSTARLMNSAFTFCNHIYFTAIRSIFSMLSRSAAAFVSLQYVAYPWCFHILQPHFVFAIRRISSMLIRSAAAFIVNAYRRYTKLFAICRISLFLWFLWSM